MPAPAAGLHEQVRPALATVLATTGNTFYFSYQTGLPEGLFQRGVHIGSAPAAAMRPHTEIKTRHRSVA